MSFEAHKLIGISLSKIAESRASKCGIKLHKNLLVATVLHKARYVFMEETYQNIINGNNKIVESTLLKSFDDFKDNQPQNSRGDELNPEDLLSSEPDSDPLLVDNDLLSAADSALLSSDSDEIVVDDSNSRILPSNYPASEPPTSFEKELELSFTNFGNKQGTNKPIALPLCTDQPISEHLESHDVTIDQSTEISLKRRHCDSDVTKVQPKKFKGDSDDDDTIELNASASDICDVLNSVNELIETTEQSSAVCGASDDNHSDILSDKANNNVNYSDSKLSELTKNNASSDDTCAKNDDFLFLSSDDFLGHRKLVNENNESTRSALDGLRPSTMVSGTVVVSPTKPTCMEIDRLSSLVSIFSFSNLSATNESESVDHCAPGPIDLCSASASKDHHETLPTYLAMTV